MVTATEYHHIGAISMIIVGSIITGIAHSVDNNMKKTCTTGFMKYGSLILLILGVVLICISIMYGLCEATGGNCGLGSSSTAVNMFYKTLTVILSIIIFIISITMLSGLSKLNTSSNTDDKAQYNYCGGKDTQQGLIILSVLSFLTMLIVSSLEMYEWYKTANIEVEQQESSPDFNE